MREEGSKQEQLGGVIETDHEVTSTSPSHVLLIFFSSTHILTHPPLTPPLTGFSMTVSSFGSAGFASSA